MLTVQDIHTYYGDSHILQGLSLTVGEGELVCLLGRNGSGKTTTIRSIIGFNKPRRGTIDFAGQDLRAMRPYRIARLGIGLVPQGHHIFPDLSVLENLVFSARKGPWDLGRVLRIFPRLKERQRHRGNQLSGGEQQMLAIARALVMNPRLLLMDEPSEGLAPLIVREVGAIIETIRSEGLAVLLVEQNLTLGLAVADRCCVLNKGRIVHESSPGELRLNSHVKHEYLGV